MCQLIQYTGNIQRIKLGWKKVIPKTDQADSLINLDSCDVVHGQFAFHGTVDSTKVAQIFMDDINLQFPVVIEREIFQLNWTTHNSVSVAHR